jgi:hypothetical protein
MNIFALDIDTQIAAQMHVSSHTTKMCIEYPQLLSTAHRVLDGTEKTIISDSGRKKKIWELTDDKNDHLYLATHVNHPSAIWARQTDKNYQWLYDLWVNLLSEYTYRYGKVHACSKLVPYLKEHPKNIPIGEFTGPTPAMPDEYIIKGDSVASYRNYYVRGKRHLAKWEGKVNSRDVPLWYRDGTLEVGLEY